MPAAKQFHVSLPEITRGHHCCLLFSSPEDQVKATVPFLALGLERDERCVFVGDATAVEQMRIGLRAAGVPLDDEVRKNRLIFSSERDYLDAGRFTPEKMLSFLQQAYDATLSEGYSALRAAGDVSWQVGPEKDFRDVVYYEALLEVFFLGKRMVGLCEYPRSDCPPEVLSGILNAHKVAGIDSEFCENFHYIPAAILLERDRDVLHSKRTEWMTSQLLRARRAEEEVFRLNAELEDRVADRTAKLAAANKELETFSYTVSHDLKAPLRAVQGFSEMLLEDHAPALAPEAQTMVRKVVESAHRMGRLIDDLLRLSRLGTTALSPERVDLTTLAREVVAEVLAGVPQRTVDATVGTLPTAWGDPSLLRQVLLNLVGNAVKYSANRERAAVEVTGSSDGTEITCSVKDDGVGFDPKHAARIFEAFHRLHTNAEFEGTGIGLAIVDRIVRSHGGRVWADSAPGRGSTFSFTLPAAARPKA